MGIPGAQTAGRTAVEQGSRSKIINEQLKCVHCSRLQSALDGNALLDP